MELKLKNVHLQVGDQLRVKGFVPNGANRFSINLGAGEQDLALHFNPRFQGGSTLLVCNSLVGGCWAQEQRQNCQGLWHGQHVEFLFKLMGDTFRVELPGGQEVLFPNRRGTKVITYVAVEGDLKLSALEVH
ncbi:hypothetical protein NHX12_022231 [Muraenolepis orangiensis]|uniref:Galectin n=1 Tax=Muraenolepis orangiensis TaxID=630683 RepID=A0A9Q0IR41_9TELE|nr:hypothetical protein NHX12_022231 [Muraenolepis orangiensis]